VSRRKPLFFHTFFCPHFLPSFFIPFVPLFPSLFSISLSHSLQHLYVQPPFLSPFLPTSPLQCESSEKYPSKCPVQRLYLYKYSISSVPLDFTSNPPAPKARYSITACKDRTHVLTLGCRRCQHFTGRSLWCTVPYTANYIRAAKTCDTCLPSMTIDVARDLME
jgi:hypothetical protein